MTEKIFFQSSMPRAGSTVLQNILAQNPDIYATPTSGVFDLIQSAKFTYSTAREFQAQDPILMNEAFLSFCRGGISSFYKPLTNRKYVIDKCRGWGLQYEFLRKIQDEPKVICIVRDLRDIFASMEKKFRKYPEIHNDIINWHKLEGTSTQKRVESWAKTMPLGVSLESISEIFRMGIFEHIHFLRYEDLCNSPQEEMNKIYDFFEIDKYNHDFKYIEQVTQEDDSVYGIFGDHKIQNELKFIPSQSKEILGKDVCDYIYNEYKWYFDVFNYSK